MRSMPLLLCAQQICVGKRKRDFNCRRTGLANMIAEIEIVLHTRFEDGQAI